MQIILNDQEIEVIFEALITEKRESLRELALAERKGRGEYEKKYLKIVESALERFKEYIK